MLYQSKPADLYFANQRNAQYQNQAMGFGLGQAINELARAQAEGFGLLHNANAYKATLSDIEIMRQDLQEYLKDWDK